MEEFIAEWVGGILIDFQQSIQSIAGLLGQDLTANTNMWDMVGTVQGIVKPICYTIMVIFFLIEFLKMSMKIDMLKWEYLFKVMAKFVIAKACIDFGPQLMEAIYATVAEWITDFGSSTYDASMYNDFITDIKHELDEMGFWSMIGFAVTSIIPCIVIVVCTFVVKVVAYGRLIEIYILLACMPIPFSFLLEGERQANITKKYILNFAGVCLQGLLIVISCSLFQYLMADVIADGSVSGAVDLLFTMVLCAAVMVLAVSKSGQWGKQLLNAM